MLCEEHESDTGKTVNDWCSLTLDDMQRFTQSYKYSHVQGHTFCSVRYIIINLYILYMDWVVMVCTIVYCCVQ